MMKVIPQSFEVVGYLTLDGEAMLKRIEAAGRTCYKSEDLITVNTARDFAKMVLRRGHYSVIEHESVSVRIICDRGVSHEIVRHRLASYSQESTRYCNYGKARFGKEVTFIEPPGLQGMARGYWEDAMLRAERAYFQLLDAGQKPEIARSVLPNSLKTEMVMTANVREWRHFFFLRTAVEAHPQMRELARGMLRDFRMRIPVLFDDVGAVDDAEACKRKALKRLVSKIYAKGLNFNIDAFEAFWATVQPREGENDERS